jgi:hypothetical protein
MREALILAALGASIALGVACAGGDSVDPSSTSTASSGSSGSGGDGGGGGGTPAGDSIPAGAVSFFQRTTCPDGWKAYDAGAGRALLPTVGPAPGGTTHGSGLTSGEDRQHTHDVGGTFTLGTTSYVGIASGGNHGVAVDGDVAFKATTAPASSGLPYVQLLACRKADKASPRPTPLPKGMLLFFETACPDGWAQASATGGRLLVGLPASGAPNKAFGGAPLGPDPRTHTHGVSATLQTMPHGIALASGCCGGGYAADGSYTSMQASTIADATMPSIELLQCEKQ